MNGRWLLRDGGIFRWMFARLSLLEQTGSVSICSYLFGQFIIDIIDGNRKNEMILGLIKWIMLVFVGGG